MMKRSTLKENILFLLVELGPIMTAVVAAVGLVVWGWEVEEWERGWEPNPFADWKWYKVIHPGGSLDLHLTPKRAEAIKSRARRDALLIERASPGTLDRICRDWSIESTAGVVDSICFELKEELKTEAKARAEAEAQAEAEAKAQADEEWSEIEERIEALHRAGGPID